MYESTRSWREVDDYFVATLVDEDESMVQTRTASHAADLPAHEVAPNQGALLGLLTRAVGARRVLEVGTLAGYSTIWLARAVGGEGRVTTLESFDLVFIDADKPNNPQYLEAALMLTHPGSLIVADTSFVMEPSSTRPAQTIGYWVCADFCECSPNTRASRRRPCRRWGPRVGMGSLLPSCFDAARRWWVTAGTTEPGCRASSAGTSSASCV